jgi:hypothetical protein
MRTITIAVLVSSFAAPAASAPACPPSRWVLSDERGRTFSVAGYGKGTSGRYTSVAFRGRLGKDQYYISNEFAPQATGGPWSSSRSLPNFIWGGNPVRLKWGNPRTADDLNSDLSVFEGPLKGAWSLKSCRK